MATPVTSLRTAAVTAELARLDARERAISQRRRELHVQIDRLYLAAPLSDADAASLNRLEASEREISTQRHRLHGEIDGLRARLGLPPWRASRELDDAA